MDSLASRQQEDYRRVGVGRFSSMGLLQRGPANNTLEGTNVNVEIEAARFCRSCFGHQWL